MGIAKNILPNPVKHSRFELNPLKIEPKRLDLDLINGFMIKGPNPTRVYYNNQKHFFSPI